MDGSGFTLPIDRCHALVLNADFRPLSYFPLSLWPWQEAVKAVFLGRVNIVSEYDRTVRSPTFEFKLPSVIALKEYVPTARRPAFTRFNVFLRDKFTCQYCGEDAPAEHLTFDHVIPRSRGGRTTWPRATACRGKAICSRAQDRCSRRRSSSRKMGGLSRPIICTRAGATSSTGIRRSIRFRVESDSYLRTPPQYASPSALTRA